LITVLYEIASESRYFIGLIAILVIGFTTSFHALGYGDGPYGWLNAWFIVATMAVVGEREASEEDLGSDSNVGLGKVTYILMMLFIGFILLNAVIAFMGDVYSKVQNLRVQEIRFMRMQVFLDFAQSWSFNKVDIDMDGFIHVLRPTTGNQKQWEGAVVHLERCIQDYGINDNERAILQSLGDKQTLLDENTNPLTNLHVQLQEMDKKLEEERKRHKSQLKNMQKKLQESLRVERDMRKQFQEQLRGEREKNESRHQELLALLKSFMKLRGDGPPDISRDDEDKRRAPEQSV